MSALERILGRLKPDHTLEVKQAEGIDISNMQLVSSRGDEILVMAPNARMTKQDAIVLAAWIVALADKSKNFTEFRSVLKAVLAA